MSYMSYDPAPPSTRWMPACVYCNNPVDLETCKTDESGKALTKQQSDAS